MPTFWPAGTFWRMVDMMGFPLVVARFNGS